MAESLNGPTMLAYLNRYNSIGVYEYSKNGPNYG